ncbi:HP1 family phage holin [Plesiomonas sp.]|uniref:HP1 family phage holin n=1 Tax=Plesiomonas sp. TaxID=2486279 RepID=UPI003F3B99D2
MEKITTAMSYTLALFLAWLGGLNVQEVAFLSGTVLGFGTFFVNWYYRRKTFQLFKDKSDTLSKDIYEQLNR